MSNSKNLSTVKVLAAATFAAATMTAVPAFAACSGSANTSCGTVPAPTPIPNPTPMPVPTPTPTPVYNGGNGGAGGAGGQGGQGGQGGAGGNASAGAAAAAAAAAQSTASAAVNANQSTTVNSSVTSSNALNNSNTANGGNATATGGSIATGAVQNTNNNTATGGAGGNATGGSATGGTSTATNTATTGNNTNTNAGNNVNIVNQQAKQATPLVAAGLTSNMALDGCVSQGSVSGGVSVVGGGAFTLGITTGSSVVKDCFPERRTDTVVGAGITSNDPAKIVIGYRAAGREADLQYLKTPEGQDDMALFANKAQVGTPVTYVAPAPTPAFVAAAAPAVMPCNVMQKGKVVPGEWKQIGDKVVCGPAGDVMAPAVK